MKESTSEQAPFDPFRHFEFLTNRIGRLLAKQVGGRCAELGYHFPTSCIGILADLWQRDGIPQKDLAINLVKSKSSITKMLDALEEEAMISRTSSLQDKRSKLIYLTDRGKHFRCVLEASSEEQERKGLTEFSHQEITITKRVLAKMYINLVDAQRKAQHSTYE
ncbi:MAG: MarR family transcriptional regulator [Bacteroidota bacterium]